MSTPFQGRYVPGKYRDCRFCGGRGCPGCDTEAEKAYKRAFPNGPQPIATFSMEELKDGTANKCIGAAVLEKAFGPGGGGIAELIENIKANGKYQEPDKSEGGK